MKTSAGLQDSGTTDESTAENVVADLDLAELIEQHENTDWSDVPTRGPRIATVYRCHRDP